LATVGASVVATAATPMFARMIALDDRAGIERITALTSLAMIGSVVVITVPVAMAGDWLFPALFGREFAASAPVFTVLAAGLFVTYSMGLAQSLANMSGHHVLTTRSFLATALINLLLGLILIPNWGALGAAIATVVSAIAGSAWCAWQLSLRTGYNTTVFNPALPKIIAGAIRAGLAHAKRMERGQGNGDRS
jgi:O-antigen/teichoic acid export membrane protein